ncbi:MAG: CvpA family protein [Ramlibacter sp.]
MSTITINYVDTFLVLVILLGVAAGWRRGFVLGMLGLCVLGASAVLTFWGYQDVARALETFELLGQPWAAPAAFLATFVVARLVLGAVASLLMHAVSPKAHAHGINRVLGTLPGLVDGLLYAMVFAVLLLAVPLWDEMTEQARESQVASRLTEPAEWLESRLTPIFHDAVSKTLNRTVVTPGSRESVTLAFKVQDPKPRPDLEARMLELVNEERVANGLKPLRADPELTEVARAHSRDMFARGYFSHVSPDGKSPFDRIRKAKVIFRTAGENLAFAPTLAQAHQGLMKSPGHRANILRPAFGRVGIGIVDGGSRGQMVTQNFRN